jgi:hypothetical protein
MQKHHLAMSSSYLNGADWTKQFTNKILQTTHLQWIYQNISLQDKLQGYIHNKRSKKLLHKLLELCEHAPEKMPVSSRFLLEINFTGLTSTHLETQDTLTLAVNAALTALSLKASRARGARLKRNHKRLNK